MKSYTNLEQSKKLAEILPLESADMHYSRVKDEEYDWIPLLSPIPKLCAEYIDNIPCWSLSALLEQLDYEVVDEEGESYYLNIEKCEGNTYYMYYETSGHFDDWRIETDTYDYLIDACVEMILKLKKRIYYE